MLARNPSLIAIELIAASIWTGSIVCLMVVTSAARASLDSETRVAFFRALGRRYGALGSAALAVSIGVGLAMLWPPQSWGPLQDTVLALAGALVVLTAIGVRQARAMTRLRREAFGKGSERAVSRAVRRGAIVATFLRATMGFVTLAVIVVVARLVGG